MPETIVAGSASALASLLVVVSGLLIFYAWWASRLRRGIPVRPWVIGLFGLVYLLLFLVAEGEVLRLPWGGVARGAAELDLLLLILAVIPAYEYTSRTISFERSAAGRWLYRGRAAIPAAWLAFFLLRYAVELALLGQIYLFAPTPSHGVTIPAFAAALILVDALFSAGTGLVLGDSIAIYSTYRRQRGQRPVPKGVAVST